MFEVGYGWIRPHSFNYQPSSYSPLWVLVKHGFFRHLNDRKHPKKFPCYKRYENSRKILDENAKCQPWIIKMKPNLDEGSTKIG
jgi:hypothetical protein